MTYPAFVSPPVFDADSPAKQGPPPPPTGKIPQLFSLLSQFGLFANMFFQAGCAAVKFFPGCSFLKLLGLLREVVHFNHGT